MGNSNNKRAYFRVNDKVALKVHAIDGGSANDLYEKRKKEIGVANRFLHDRESKRPSLLSIEKRFPEVASYIEYLEDKIQTLANQSSGQIQLPQTPTHEVSLSATGVCYNVSEPLPLDTRLEITMRLFPSRMMVYVIGRVTRCSPVAGGQTYDVAVKYTHIHEEDEDLLFKHVNYVQMDSLKVVVN